MSPQAVSNSRREIARRRAIGRLTWSGPALMLFARSIFSFLAQGLVAGIWPPALFQPLALAPAIYAVLVFPALWGVTEQMTYNGYLLPRFQVLSGSTGVAVALVAFAWSFQHALLPLTFDPDFMLYRALAPIPFSTFVTLLYLRVRRLLPFVIAHWLMDGAAALVSILLPLVR